MNISSIIYATTGITMQAKLNTVPPPDHYSIFNFVLSGLGYYTMILINALI